ncbi:MULTISPECIES: ATP-binding cassette domain-containing protein [unclassified Prevotella]|uniref:ATP-binding cassette domain-containing protein n=1 Tax=unclassified Prevotella TaxID=2638335 RepID=UPI000CEA1AAD|nr:MULTISPECIES: ATP-binding cassette domain-containing protein [unclassified Prevotella]NPD54580.1 ATP-binding cassette domain-containing protein [Prevotella sp. PTAC]GAY28619.1 ABC transporter ATP-binding protein [Prevotella sp. MGM1]
MDKLELCSVLPSVFADNDRLCSDVWNSNVTFERGHVYLMESESGKGKSTFCSYMLGYRNDYSGKISFDHEDIKSFTVSNWCDIRKNHISHLFQELRLFPELTALENVIIKNNLVGFKEEKEIKDWFEVLGIADKLNVPVRYMSFGQQQRVALMRALVQPFDFIIADEPISHLDDNNAVIMGKMIVAEAQRQGAGIIMTSIGKHIDMKYEKTLRL